VRTHACGARSSAGARLSPLLFIVKQVAPAELSAFFSFGSARKQIAPPARMRRFAPSCSRSSLRSSYLLPIVPWCACCARACAPSFSQSSRARLRVCVASLPHAVGLRCARPTSCLLSLGARAAARACAPSFHSQAGRSCVTPAALSVSFLLAPRARLLRVYVASLPHAVGLRCARPTLVRAAGLHILSFFPPPLPLPLSFTRPLVNAKIFARPRVNARARVRAFNTFTNMRLSAT